MNISIISIALVCVQSYNTYGKTEAQILSMSASDWQTFYTSKAGDSTVSECDGATIYGMAMSHRDDRMAKAAGRTKLVTKIRGLLTPFGQSCVGLAENMAGGGTIWQTFYADIPSQVEGVVFGSLGGKETAPKHFVVSGVMALFHQTEAAVAKEHADKNDVSIFKYGAAVNSLKTIREQLAGVLAEAKGMPRADSDRMLSFCADNLELDAKGLAGP